MGSQEMESTNQVTATYTEGSGSTRNSVSGGSNTSAGYEWHPIRSHLIIAHHSVRDPLSLRSGSLKYPQVHFGTCFKLFFLLLTFLFLVLDPGYFSGSNGKIRVL